MSDEPADYLVTVTGTKEYSYDDDELQRSSWKEAQDDFVSEHRAFNIRTDVEGKSRGGTEAVVHYESTFGVRRVASKQAAIDCAKDRYDLPDGSNFEAKKDE